MTRSKASRLKMFAAAVAIVSPTERLATFLRRFSLKTVLMLADQMLNRVESVHARNFLHRDIKPENFLIGLGTKACQVHMIDFGIAKKYRDPKTKQHIPYRRNKNFTGTARYASVCTHLGIEQSRRDDLEAIGYMLMYFRRGSLPWQGLKAKFKAEKYDQILKKKMSMQLESHGVPGEFVRFTKTIGFEDRPDYAYLRLLLKDLFFRGGFEYDLDFDWMSPNDQSRHDCRTSSGQFSQDSVILQKRRCYSCYAGCCTIA
eukprot:NODE_14085_length_1129_cov_8.430140.p1 GENE.NODE_14085_length_1129_cov_8.430140~~NODE_14085_length_1129_cov_8.430140.p1  ORF type:complete len:259 (+),score=37.21 NODE_14085_length_1129_cov_8.430140:306-1082(+)